MTTLSDEKAALVRRVVELAPDRALGQIEAVLNDARGDPAMAAIRHMVEREMGDRQVREAVFAPLSPWLKSQAPGLIGALWRGLHALTPLQIAEARQALLEWRRAEEPPPAILDTLCALAGEGLASEDLAFADARAAAGERRGLLVEDFALAALARRAAPHLVSWTGRSDRAEFAALRVIMREASAVRADGGPRLLEILSAHLVEPWRVLRVVSTLMERPNERFLAASELAVFAERALDGVEARVADVQRFDPSGGPDAARAAADAAHDAVARMTEFEDCMVLRPGGPWASRLLRHRRALAQAGDFWLREAGPAVEAALPLQQTRFAARMVKGVPRLTADPDPAKAARAEALLTFLHETRSSAPLAGFGALRSKVLEKLVDRLDRYVEDLLDHLRGENPEHPERARAYLDLAAAFTALVMDDKAAQIVRRRAAAA